MGADGDERLTAQVNKPETRSISANGKGNQPGRARYLELVVMLAGWRLEACLGRRGGSERWNPHASLRHGAKGEGGGKTEEWVCVCVCACARSWTSVVVPPEVPLSLLFLACFQTAGIEAGLATGWARWLA